MAEKETLGEKAQNLFGSLLSSIKGTDINALKREIIAYRSFAKESLNVLDDANPGGYEHAVVIRKGTNAMLAFKDITHGDFKIDSEVTIHPDSQFAKVFGAPEGSGTIESFDPEGYTGWAWVKFKNKGQALRYGNPNVDDGVSDLILLGEPVMAASDRETITVFSRNGIFEVFNLLNIKVSVGDTVLIHSRNQQIVSKVDSIHSGVIGTIEEVFENQLVVAVNGQKHVVEKNTDLEGQYDRSERVCLDQGLNVALSILPRSKSIAINTNIEPVRWSDVIGLEDAKIEAHRIIDQVKYPELYKSYKSKTSGGILLIGPPGNGKTLFGKAVATELSKLFGGESGMVGGFMYIKGTEILDMFVGESPRKVRDLFAKAEEYFNQTGRKAIMFIDEVEAVMKVRGNKSDSGSSDAVTNAFLTEMGGIQKSCAFVIGATNRPDLIDEAAMRPGRFDKKIFVGRPEKKDVSKFFELYFKDVPLAQSLTLDAVVKYATSRYISKDYTLYDLKYEKKKGEGTDNYSITFLEVGSGAMIEGIVIDAKNIAIERDIKSASATQIEIKPTGITLADIDAVMKSLYNEQKRFDHETALKEYGEKNDAELLEVKKR